MITNVNGAFLSDKLINLITVFQEENSAYCDILLDVLNDETDNLVDSDLKNNDEEFKKLKCIRELHSLIKHIKTSANDKA